MIISIDTKKAFVKIQQPSMILKNKKHTQQAGNRRKLPQPDKEHL